MADSITLHDFETPILGAAVSILSGSGITAMPIQRDDEDVSTPRVELQLLVNGPGKHQAIISGSIARPDKYNCQLNAVVVTNRTRNPVSHSVYVSRVVDKLTNNKNFNSGSLLPYHYMGGMDLINAIPTISSEDGTDMTAVAINCDCWIKQSSW